MNKDIAIDFWEWLRRRSEGEKDVVSTEELTIEIGTHEYDIPFEYKEKENDTQDGRGFVIVDFTIDGENDDK